MFQPGDLLPDAGWNAHLRGARDRPVGQLRRNASRLHLDGAGSAAGTGLDPPNTTIFSGPANPTTKTTATFTFAGSDNATPGTSLTYECRLDDDDEDDFEPCVSPVTYTGLDDEAHTFEVRAIDLAGNVDPTPAVYTWTINEAPPDVNAPETTIESGSEPDDGQHERDLYLLRGRPGR